MVCINFDDLCCAAGNKCYFETASFVTNKNFGQLMLKAFSQLNKKLFRFEFGK